MDLDIITNHPIIVSGSIVIIIISAIMIYFWSKSPYRGMSKEEKQQTKAEKRKRHRVAMVTVFFDDQTYLAQQVDIDKVKGDMEIEGKKYHLPSMPMKVRGWWPFKARTFKAKIFPDAHYNIDFEEGMPDAIGINYVMEGESNYIHPMTYKAMVNEKGYEKMLQSIKKKKAFGLDTKWVVVIIAVIAIAGLIIAKLMGLF